MDTISKRPPELGMHICLVQGSWELQLFLQPMQQTHQQKKKKKTQQQHREVRGPEKHILVPPEVTICWRSW